MALSHDRTLSALSCQIQLLSPSPPPLLLLVHANEQRINCVSDLAGVVDAELGDLSERSSLLSEVDDDADAAALRALDGAQQCVHQVRAARADVRAEGVRAGAL